MSGSSRSLIRSLNTVFDNWEHDTPTQTSELFNSIRSYLQKHNTLSVIKSSANIHTELYSFYNNYIKPSANLPTEILFLEILIELSPVLSQEEIDLWLHTYLKPAVDSANYDNKFVEWCRKFIIKVTCTLSESSDPPLVAYRRNIAESVMSQILNLYLGTQLSSYDIIDLTPTDSERTSQEFSERIRFIKTNCRSLLCTFAVDHLDSFCQITNPKFLDSKTRLGVLTLLSYVANSKCNGIADIVKTELFANVIRCAAYDINHKIIRIVIGILVMLIPFVASEASSYITDLLLAYTRACGDLDSNTVSNSTWDIVPTDPTTEEIDSERLLTMIYGLFPYTLTIYIQDPKHFVTKYPPSIVDKSVVAVLGKTHMKIAEESLKNFKLHPNFLRPAISIEWELQHPTDSKDPEEISIECLNLNPNSFTSRPGDRKLSIVATNLVIESKDSEPSGKEFESNRKDSEVTFSSNYEEDVKDLFATHEKLYSQRVNEDGGFLGDKLKAQPSLASIATKENGTETLAHDKPISPLDHPISPQDRTISSQDLTSIDKFSGSIIDYYQRELLLLKNEMEFSSYIKHLNKFQYIKLKQKMDKMVKDNLNEKFKYEQLTKNYLQLETSYSDMKLQFETLSDQHQNANSELTTKFLECQDQKNQLEVDIANSNQQIQSMQKQIQQLQSVSDDKDAEINDITSRLRVLESDYDIALKELQYPPKPKVTEQLKTPELDDNEREIARLQIENSSQKETIDQMIQEIQKFQAKYDSMVKSYETKISTSKNDLAYLMNTLGNTNEKKIQELSGAFLKYENLIEEKNLRIAQLSTSRPISIPGSGSFTSERYTPMDIYEHRQNSNSSADSIPFNTPPLQTAIMKNYPMMQRGSGTSTTSSTPIIKGRGGYQKRSKKHM